MTNPWIENIRANVQIVKQNAGPSLAMVVSGSEEDAAYWQKHFTRTRRDVFRENGSTEVVSVFEKTRKGNFLGTFNAWLYATKHSSRELPPMAIMSMVFGMGKRLSPFTQALRNRKSAFPIPLKSRHENVYLCTADLSTLYSNLWAKHLSDSGFRGVIVKWGDEAIVPSLNWLAQKADFSEVDAIRFVWKTEITEDLAREKEWVAIADSGLMCYQLTRQAPATLKQRLETLPFGSTSFGVNLGSLALSYDFLQTGLEVLGEDIQHDKKWVDWDPYAWIALCCADRQQWEAEAEHERQTGRHGIEQLEARYPDFFEKIVQLREALEQKKGRKLAIGVLDFGQAFWTDNGLHLTLRRSLESLTEDTEQGTITRELYQIPHERDENGNIVVNSHISPDAKVTNSVIINSHISDGSTIHKGVVVGSKVAHLEAPMGGSVLQCNVENLTLQGEHAIAFLCLGEHVEVDQGGRKTALLLPDRYEHMGTNESLLNYDDNYSEPVFDNRLSFEEAFATMSKISDKTFEQLHADHFGSLA
jgi:hypothetical protein